MNNFVKRTLSGFFFVTLIVASILLSRFTFIPVFALIAGWTVFEFHSLSNVQANVQVNPWKGVIGAVLLFISTYLYVSGSNLSRFSIVAYGLYLIIAFILELYAHKTNPVHNLAYFTLGQVLVAFPFASLNYILFINGYQPFILLAVFVTIWINDTGAYLVGITFGKHRLFERISPKKSWEGFFGGVFFTLVSGYVFSLLIPQISLLNWLIFSEIIVIFGTFGDLIESLLKRTIDIKDSGNVIPGHGGLLDRFDSMLLAAPAVFMFLHLLFQY